MLQPVDLSPDLAKKYPVIVQLAGDMEPEVRNQWFLDIRRALHDPESGATQRDFDAINALTTSFEMAQLADFLGTSSQCWTKSH